MFEREYRKCKQAVQNDVSEEGPEGAKESRNLLTLILELYNFQVISCVLVYDLVRMLISELDETNVELLLRIIRSKLKSILKKRTCIFILAFTSCWSGIKK